MAKSAGHAVVVGGTGMLRGVCLALSQTHGVVSVVARSPERLADLRQAAGDGVVRPIAEDFRNTPRLFAALDAAQGDAGPATLAVLWTPDDVATALIAWFAAASASTRVIRVLGSLAAAPGQDPYARRRLLPIRSGLTYQEAVLGFVIKGDTARWLSHREISEGVLRAASSGCVRTVIGDVRPWRLRPEA